MMKIKTVDNQYSWLFELQLYPPCGFELDAERTAECRHDYAERNDERKASERTSSEFLKRKKVFTRVSHRLRIKFRLETDCSIVSTYDRHGRSVDHFRDRQDR